MPAPLHIDICMFKFGCTSNLSNQTIVYTSKCSQHEVELGDWGVYEIELDQRWAYEHESSENNILRKVYSESIILQKSLDFKFSIQKIVHLSKSSSNRSQTRSWRVRINGTRLLHCAHYCVSAEWSANWLPPSCWVSPMAKGEWMQSCIDGYGFLNGTSVTKTSIIMHTYVK